VSPNSRLQSELKQNKPFVSRAAEATISLVRTADLIRRNLSNVMATFDLTIQQFNVLRILRGAGAQGLPTLEIAERMIEQTPGITRLIDRLETKQLVLRVRCLTDRRQVFCHITEEGLALLDTLEAPVHEAQELSLGGMSKGDLEQLVKLLDRARMSLTEALTASPVEPRTAVDERKMKTVRSPAAAHRSTLRKQAAM
jgi:DNA-binding MarR family transcriptional regulator